MTGIASVLIANRGEIAVRVARTAREMGIRTIAVYSELDRDSLHVQMADEAWSIGPPPPSVSYLNQSRILEVAKESGAEAVHPGYGFLSENAGFAAAVASAGLVWIGPPPEAISAMGDKISSRRTAAAAGVRAVPGTTEPMASSEAVLEAAQGLGYPVAIKASYGGGGRGLRVVNHDDECRAAFEGARREADAYFGNPEVYVEKYLERPRHVEAQILVDLRGKGVFLGERDCSVQRRHQKLIEETPSTALTDKTRKALGHAALAVAKSCGYANAGTVEFLVDGNGEFYFLEMNTRLQVEHTITEMVTGIDLVREQIKIANGEALSFTEVSPRGHAIELRINAEDPHANYLPTPGRVVEYAEPAGFGVRVDGWVRTGTLISQFYDNLMAKLVVWGEDRPTAIARAQRALSEFSVQGVSTTIPAHRAVLTHPDFLAGTHHTGWLESEVSLPPATPQGDPTLPEDEELERRDMTVEVSGKRFQVAFWAPPAPSAGGEPVRRRRPKLATARDTDASDGVVTAPMQGTIVKVHVKAGDHVEIGQSICILEAMKMENEVRSPMSGEVVDVKVRPGDTVANGAVVAVLK